MVQIRFNRLGYGEGWDWAKNGSAPDGVNPFVAVLDGETGGVGLKTDLHLMVQIRFGDGQGWAKNGFEPDGANPF